MSHSLTKSLFSAAVLACCTLVPASAQAVDAEAARKLTNRNNCLRCHDVGRDAVPFKELAEKYRGDAQAEAKLIKHLTTAPEVTFPDGSKDLHKDVRTTPAEDAAQVKNLVQWILAM